MKNKKCMGEPGYHKRVNGYMGPLYERLVLPHRNKLKKKQNSKWCQNLNYDIRLYCSVAYAVHSLGPISRLARFRSSPASFLFFALFFLPLSPFPIR